VKQSALLSLLEPGDQLLADKGFVIDDLLQSLGYELAIPAFLKSKRAILKNGITGKQKDPQFTCPCREGNKACLGIPFL